MADKEKEKLISAEAADALIAAHDGDMALCWLYFARHPGADDETAAAVLCRTRGEIAAAREKLGRILPGERREPLAPPPTAEETQYPSDELVKICRRPEFEDIRNELTRILGETPSRAYLNTLVDIYDRLGMPPEVILLLLNHCDAETRRLSGNRRRPSAKRISDEAYYWVNREIMTLEAAEEYIERCEKRRSDRGRVAGLLGIRGRELYKREAEYIDAWLEMGFSDEAIALALERTVMNTGALKWPYLNGILRNWHASGLHTAEEIEQAEGKRKKVPGRERPDPVIDEDELDRTIERITGEKT